MRTVTLPIGPDGPLATITMTLPAPILTSLRAAGQAIPPPVTCQALIDTGSDATVIDPTVLTPLRQTGLQTSRILFANIPARGGLMPALEVLLTLAIEPASNNARLPTLFRNFAVIERGFGALGYQALLGRDVLEHALMVYDGPSQRVTLALP